MVAMMYVVDVVVMEDDVGEDSVDKDEDEAVGDDDILKSLQHTIIYKLQLKVYLFHGWCNMSQIQINTS